MNNKRLYKSSVNYMLCGVCGGIAEYFNIDKTVVRVAFALISLMSGVFLGVVFYIVCMMVMPDKDI